MFVVVVLWNPLQSPPSPLRWTLIEEQVFPRKKYSIFVGLINVIQGISEMVMFEVC